MNKKAPFDLFATAQHEVASGKVGPTCGDESHIILVGSRGCGKSSIMLRFLDRTEIPKPTTALEYTFGRKSKTHNAAIKDVAHIWELGGGSSHAHLLEVPIQAKTLLSTSLLIVVDLSKPETVWSVFEKLMREVRMVIDRIISQLSPEEKKNLMAATKERLNLIEDVGERQSIDPFPIPLTLVGGKYDVFSEFESEKRKVVTRCMRFLAHSHGASLVFFSDKSEVLVSRIRAFMSHYIFSDKCTQKHCDRSPPTFADPIWKRLFRGYWKSPSC